MSRNSRLAKREEWKKRLARYGKSNRTVGQFCLTEGVSIPSFYHWRKKLRPLPTATPAVTGRFQPVHVVWSLATPHRQATIIRWGRGLEIELGSDLAVVAAVVKPLLEAAHSERSNGGPSC
jgi:ribosomal protein L39E